MNAQQKESAPGLEVSAPTPDWTVRYDAVFCIFAAGTAYFGAITATSSFRKPFI